MHLSALAQAEVTHPGLPYQRDKNFAFLVSIHRRDHAGDGLRRYHTIRASRSQAAAAARLQPIPGGGMDGRRVPGVVSTVVPDSLQKVTVGGPNYSTRSRLKSCSPPSATEGSSTWLKGRDPWDCPRDTLFAETEYLDGGVSDQAIAGLNGMQLEDKKLKSWASVRAKNYWPWPSPAQIQVPGMAGMSGPGRPSRCSASTLVVEEELQDEEEYEDIWKTSARSAASSAR